MRTSGLRLPPSQKCPSQSDFGRPPSPPARGRPLWMAPMGLQLRTSAIVCRKSTTLIETEMFNIADDCNKICCKKTYNSLSRFFVRPWTSGCALLPPPPPLPFHFTSSHFFVPVLSFQRPPFAIVDPPDSKMVVL